MLKKQSVFIATYTFVYKGIVTNNAGALQPLYNFFKDKVKWLYLLEQPLPGSDFLETQLKVIRRGELVEVIRKNFFFSKFKGGRLNSNKTYIRLKLRDFFSNLYFFLKKYKFFPRKRIDLFIGVESINAIFGILMRKLGLVGKVVYYIFDWAPDRYNNPIMNKVYLWLDKYATYYSDYTWNITYAIAEAKKEKLGYKEEEMSSQIYVPYSAPLRKKHILPSYKIDPNLVIYAGGLAKEHGTHLLVKAFQYVLKECPQARLLIIGGGEDSDKLRNFVKSNRLEDSIHFTGYIADEEEVVRLQCKGAIGVAPYPFLKGSRKLYGDVIKIRMYFACGLVVVTTPVPPSSREVAEEKLGIRVANDSPPEIARGIIYLLKNKKLLFTYRKNVIKKAYLSNWKKNYTAALVKMGFRV